MSGQPKVLDDQFSRDCARRVRDAHWGYLERIAQLEGEPLYVRLWNKYRKPDAPNVLNMCLLSGMDFMRWVRSHPEWFDIAPWDEDMYADPFRITEAGRKALTERHLYDMEPHEGGLIEPGYVVTPSPTTSQPAVTEEEL